MTKPKTEIRCPKCSISIMVSADQAGEKVECPRCQKQLLVPGEKKSGKSARQGVPFDDLIDIDDGETSNNLAGQAIEDAAFGGKKAKQVVEDVAASAQQAKDAIEDVASDLPPELRLAPDDLLSKNPPASTDDTDETKPAADQNEVVDDDDDDLGDLLDIQETPTPIPVDTSADNPFEVDENKNLSIDGVTPSDGQFSVDCKLCGSLLYARLSQVGTQIKCHDCYSLVEVPAPKTKPKPVESFDAPSSNDGDSGYELSDPVELKSLDTTFDNTLGDIDFDDDEFFEERKERQRDQVREAAERAGAMPPSEEDDDIALDEGVELEVMDDEDDEIKIMDDTVDSVKEQFSEPEPEPKKQSKPKYVDEDDDGEDYSLAPSEPPPSIHTSANNSILQDFAFDEEEASADSSGGSSGVVEDESLDRQAKANTEKKKKDKKKKGDLNDSKLEEPTSPEKLPEANRLPADKRQPTKKKTRKERLEEEQTKPLDHFEDSKGPFAGIGPWIGSCIKPFKSAMFLLRLALSGIVLGVAYMILSYGLGMLAAEEATKLSMFVAFLVALLGFIPMAFGSFFFATVANPIIQSAINRDEDVGEFPEFSLGTFAGEMLYIGTSFWAASLPGVLLGALVAAIRQDPFWIPVFAIISSLMLVPIFLSSVMQHQSPWMLISDKVIKTLGKLKFRWLRFFTAAFLVGVLITSSLLLTRFGAFGFVVAFVQLFLLGLYYWMLGDLIGYVLRRIQNDATE